MQSVLDYQLEGRKITRAYQDKGVVYASDGTVYTRDLFGCFGILVYLEKSGTTLGAALGHHSTYTIARNELRGFWQRFLSANPETKEYSGGKILISGCRQAEMFRSLCVRADTEMKSLFPGLNVIQKPYRFSTDKDGYIESDSGVLMGGGVLEFNLETLEWRTKEYRGSFKRKVS